MSISPAVRTGTEERGTTGRRLGVALSLGYRELSVSGRQSRDHHGLAAR